MLIPLTRQALKKIIPAIATGAQYVSCWGRARDVLRRLLISVVALTAFWLIGKLLGPGSITIKLIFDIIAGLYWLWAPIYWANLRNTSYRRFPYSGFWQGQVLDVYLTEEIVREEQTVNKRGELVLIENRERRINLEVGDHEQFRSKIKAPVKQIYKVIKPGDIAEMIILSKQSDLSQIDEITDVYLPQHNLWLGEYPYLRRDIFTQVSEELGTVNNQQMLQRNYPNQIKRRRR
ncbi:phosphate ABC transporter permease [Cyanobacterium sp. uoEpiScrs1]|uniref:phosphate ABC transporter permease n=1 Tax=Cyanobacterium sp. uoEpiScrs1 TaxID=2976343 RepID=UPI00226ADE24|nr:phosphate ABC transporter permease [Cyanobacterium sp. uoEpiScrs1]